MTDHNESKEHTPRFCKTGNGVQSFLRSIANKAKEQPKYRFRNLYGMIDLEMLNVSWKALNKKAVAGIDRVTFKAYEADLEVNLQGLLERVKRKAYRARLVKRKYIPKGDGKERPLGIPTLEDRLLQKAVALILEAIYEPTFLDCSFGYRPGRDGKKAIKDFRDELHFNNYNFVVEADIKGFFDHLDHDWLIKMLEQRLDDKNLTRLLKKWLKAGILEPDGKVINPLTGTPQGGIVSPILANVYLHYVLDLWVEKKLSKASGGALKYVRYADDFVCAFTRKDDAENFYESLPKRLAGFGLEVAEEKTRMLNFGRYQGKANQSFEFLGFALSWGKDRSGRAHLKRRTGRIRMRRAVKGTGEWIKKNRSRKIESMIDDLNSKLRGHYQYFGVIGNASGLGLYFHLINRLLFKWLNRRSQKKSMTWKQYQIRVGPRLSRPKIVELRVLQRKLPGIRC